MGFKMVLIYTFKYTDVKGKVTDRVMLPHIVPSTNYSGTDITELDEETRGLFIAEMEAAKERYVERVRDITAKYDLNYKYRQFRPEKMADVTTETI